MKNARCCQMRQMPVVTLNFSWLIPDRKARKNLTMLLTLLLAAAVQAANIWYVDANLGKDGGSGATRDGAKQSIQEAIDAAAEGDIIEVNDGTYEPIQTADKAITIRSVNGPEKTIIDGGGVARCATLGGLSSEHKTVLDGFTLQNGYAGNEGEFPAQGGGAFGGTLNNCILVDNKAIGHGGGAYDCFLTNCTLTGNQAHMGGGAHSCLVMTNCTLIGNTVTGYGGGAYNGPLTNCIVVGNTAAEGGGLYMGGLINSTVIGNTATEIGGGAVLCGRIVNSIVWGNTAPEDANYSESYVYYSCTEPLPEGEEAGGGNISADPMFTDAENGDYTLKKDSPCIDKGSNEFVEIWDIETDLAGNPRIMGGTVDMGAYEASSEGVPNKTWYVDANQPDDAGDGRTWETAKKTIQAAINRAANDDTILVNDGTYEPIDASKKAIAIRSVNGAEKTIIDGGGVARCAALGSDSERKTTLEGFTLQNGCANDGGGGACSGTLRHCLVQNNSAKNGGGVYDCVVDNCVLANNSANKSGDDDDYKSYGGGAYKSVLANCVLRGNLADYYGGGASESELLNCLLTGNVAECGGGTCDSLLVNCTVTKNHADSGGGIAASYEGIRDSTAYNCIIWGNSAWTATNYDEDSNLAYSCSYPWASEGDGNISRRAPIFVDAANGDFRLRTGSPGIDAGNSEIFEEFAEVDTDLAGNPRISGAKIDMGAYEGAVDGYVISGRVQGNGILSPMTAVVIQGGSVTFTATATDGAFRHFEVDGVVVSESATYAWENIQADGVITAVFATSTWHVDANRPDDSGDGSSWDTAKKTIQAAIDKAAAGDLVLVKPGVYAPIAIDDKAITIRSVNGAATTVIDGNGEQRCATLSDSYFGRQTMLDGFTLQNGAATTSGGGLFGGTVLNCRITNCLAEGNDESERTNGGGGASYATLRSCILSKNKAPFGGAAEHCTLDNCVLTANQASNFGGGASSCILSNCTITDNAAPRGGGGVFECTVYNSIVWNNQTEEEDANYDTDETSYTPSELYYSCSMPKPQGAGNISGAPCFVDALHGDFRLRSGSPCIDAGDNRFVQSATDLAGNPRISNAKVDMGAYEDAVNGYVISGRVQGNGTLSPLTVVVAEGGSVAFHATAGAGVFQHFLVDGEIVSESPDYTWENIQADGIITAVFTSVTWYVDDDRPDDSGNGLSWNAAKKTIQAALDMAVDGDEVVVKAGVYEPIDGYGKKVTVRSFSGAEDTIIDGGGTRRCALAANLVGFTLRNGSADAGGGASECVLNQCVLSGNTAISGGGAYKSTLNNCLLTGNKAMATWGAGGGGAAASTLNNCTVAGNSAEKYYGGVYNCILRNCIVWDNSAEPGSAGSDHVYSEFRYSCSKPLPGGEGNICEVPLFVSAEAGDFRLSAESPCRDTGSNEFATGDVDLDGNPRIFGEAVDMGAFEFVVMPILEYDWQSGWNVLYLPFDRLDRDTAAALAEMPVFRLSANTYVKDKPVSLHTPLWVFCADPESAPDLRGILTQGEPTDPLDIPAGQWALVGAQCKTEELSDEYVVWEWRNGRGRYNRVKSLQAGHVYFIYRFKTP
jgi:hypothetical protein